MMNPLPKRRARVSQVPKLPGYEWLTHSSLRHMLFNAKPRKNSKGEALPSNGLEESGAIMRFGKSILIDLDKFDAWVASHTV